MTTTHQTRVSINVNEPSVSSPLLASTNPVSNYSGAASRPPVTDRRAIIQEVWYNTLKSIFLLEWIHIRESFDDSWRSKLEAIWKCFRLPFYVLIRALNGQSRYFRQNGIMYLYMYLGVTVILSSNTPVSVKVFIQQLFLISSMVVAIILMLHILKNVRRTATFPSSHSTLLRIFYETGLFVFGFSSVGYSVAVAVTYSSCSQKLDAAASGMKAVFTFLQIVFFHCLYRARIPKDTQHIEIILAHLFGTNLALWFCTLYADWNFEECMNTSVKKYFTPLFVEFLLLGASLFYQIWKDLLSEDTISLSPQHMCTECQRVLYRNLLANNDGDSQSVNSNGTDSNSTSRHPGMIIGGCFAALFIVLIILAKFSPTLQGFPITYIFCITILYLAQICACYICQASLQFHQRDAERFPLDHEDTLLYVSLAAVVLCDGYQVYTIIGYARDRFLFDIAVANILAILQQLFQTATLVKLRFHQHTPGQSQVWIRECLSFLLVTNLILWFEESFFIDVDITTSDERYIEYSYMGYPYIIYLVHPLSIFYRFHSSVCCVLAWTQ